MGNTNAQLVHIWAQGNNITARSSNGNISCYRNRLYSYSTCIAMFYNDIAVYTNYYYSTTTTAKHVIHIPRSLTHKVTFRTPREIDTLPPTFNEFILQHAKDTIYVINERLLELPRKHKKLRYINEIQALATNVLNMIDTYALGKRKVFNNAKLTYVELLSLVDNDNTFAPLLTKYADIVKKEAIEAKKARSKLLVRERSQIKEWVAHRISTLHLKANKNIFLRLSKNKQDIETSGNAVISIQDGLALYSAIESGTLKVGMKVGNLYNVRYIDDEIIKIGCHTMKLSVIKAFGETLSR